MRHGAGMRVHSTGMASTAMQRSCDVTTASYAAHAGPGEISHHRQLPATIWHPSRDPALSAGHRQGLLLGLKFTCQHEPHCTLSHTTDWL